MVPKEILETFKVPFLYKVYAWLITLVIIIAGIYFSMPYPTWQNLGRAGAVIVVLALGLEGTGLVQKFIDKIINTLEKVTPQIVELQVKRNSNLYGDSDKRTEDEIKEIVDKESKKRVEDIRTLIEKTAYKDLKKTEFLIATVGTLLWAFADIIPKI